MDLFVVIVEDRHADVDVRVFSAAERAIAAAKQDAADNARSPESIEEEDPTGAGILYYATWSTEGDCVSVVTRTLDEGVPSMSEQLIDLLDQIAVESHDLGTAEVRAGAEWALSKIRSALAEVHAPLASDATIAEAATMEERDRVAGGPPWEVPSHPENFQPGGWHHGQIR